MKRKRKSAHKYFGYASSRDFFLEWEGSGYNFFIKYVAFNGTCHEYGLVEGPQGVTVLYYGTTQERLKKEAEGACYPDVEDFETFDEMLDNYFAPDGTLFRDIWEGNNYCGPVGMTARRPVYEPSPYEIDALMERGAFVDELIESGALAAWMEGH